VLQRLDSRLVLESVSVSPTGSRLVFFVAHQAPRRHGQGHRRLLFRLEVDAFKHIIKRMDDTFVDMLECGRSLPLALMYYDAFGRLLNAASFGARWSERG